MNASIDDIRRTEDGLFFKIENEKTSACNVTYHRSVSIFIVDSIEFICYFKAMRYLAIPKEFIKYFDAWIVKRDSLNLKHKKLFVDCEFEAIKPRLCTNYVQELAKKFTGSRLSPLDFRHIRATNFYHAIMENNEEMPAEKLNSLERYAKSVGQTVEIMKSYYVYFSPDKLAAESLENSILANELLHTSNS